MSNNRRLKVNKIELMIWYFFPGRIDSGVDTGN